MRQHHHGQRKEVAHDCTGGECASEMSHYRKVFAIALVIALMEILGGIWSGSLALLSDSGHVSVDAVAVLISMAVYGAVHSHSYRHWREARLQAIGNYFLGGLFFVTTILILYGVKHRFHSDIHISTPTMLIISILGFFGNCWQVIITRGGIRHSLNITLGRHFWIDASQSFCVIGGGVIIKCTGWVIVDIVCSIAIAIVSFCCGCWTIWSTWKDNRHHV